MKRHTRTYTDPGTGEVVAQYISLDGELWMQALTTEEVETREEARRSIRQEAKLETEGDVPE